MSSLGIIQGNSEYHANKAIGSTTIKKYLDNPLKAFLSWKGEIDVKKTDALVMGSLTHCLTLEPHTFNDEFYLSEDGKISFDEELMNHIAQNIDHKSVYLYPKEVLTPSGNLSSSAKALELIGDFRDTNGDGLYLTPAVNKKYALWLKLNGKTVVTQEQYDEAEKIAQKALAYEFQITTTDGVFRFTLQDAINNEAAIMERAFYAWWNPSSLTFTKEKVDDDAIEVKTKPDILLSVGNDTYVAIDLKTSVDASPNSFNRGSGLFYFVQEAHYTKILEANGLKIYKFLFLFAGKEAWSTVQQYEYGPASKELGVDMLHRGLNQHWLALKGDVRETVFENGKYDREPVIEVPAYMHYK